jgi:predicted metal-dependent hydrolase
MNTIIILLLVVVIVYFIYRSIYVYNEVSYIKSDIDNNEYIIRRGNTKSEKYLKDSANTLAEINKRVLKLVDHMDKKYAHDYTKRYFIDKLKQNYTWDILSEAALDSRYTTYTVDKQDMHICLRTRDSNEKIYDIDLLMYVVLHELAHLCNYDKNSQPIIGHGKEFKEIFRILVLESIDLGIYNYTDYTQNPKEYCGIVISTTIL